METYDFASLLASGLKKDTESVIAIGVFDGLHRGHQAILEKVAAECRKNPVLEPWVITFSTNPKKKGEKSIDTMRLRAKWCREKGIKSFAVIDFSPEFSRISASGFCSALLSMTKPREIVVGGDFRFGNPSDQGTADTMHSVFASLGADVNVTKVDFILDDEGEKLSSTALRDQIKNGLLEEYFMETGRRYLIDLDGLEPGKGESGETVFGTDAIRQVLPPMGSYEGFWRAGDGKHYACLIGISNELLSIVRTVDDSAFGSGSTEDETDIPENTLLFSRRS